MGSGCSKGAVDGPPAFTPSAQWNDKRQESAEEIVVPMTNDEFALRTLQYDATGKGIFEKFEVRQGVPIRHSSDSEVDSDEELYEPPHVIDDDADRAATAKMLANPVLDVQIDDQQEQAQKSPVRPRAFGARIVAPVASVGILPGLYEATKAPPTPETDVPVLSRAKPRGQ
ncbi:hypothetical protein ACHHYP_01784 [Achlya hypogyna]|uniref:Uncharacterized protein n=1 Tax=Achlya hypogyna TaxID=1202772 RepID=A0A1V9ZT29_ACHHY|nr:hypothetical protein ACHHYP_01784 [Achlya hypogyna]